MSVGCVCTCEGRIGKLAPVTYFPASPLVLYIIFPPMSYFPRCLQSKKRGSNSIVVQLLLRLLISFARLPSVPFAPWVPMTSVVPIFRQPWQTHRLHQPHRHRFHQRPQAASAPQAQVPSRSPPETYWWFASMAKERLLLRAVIPLETVDWWANMSCWRRDRTRGVNTTREVPRQAAWSGLGYM